MTVGMIDWASLYVSEQCRLRRLVRRLVGSETVAEDVFQDAFLNLLGAAPDAGIHQPRSYLTRTVRNLAIDHLRRKKLQERYFVSLDVAQSVPSETPDAEQSAAYRLAVERLGEAIDELPPKCRQVFVLHKFDGLSYREIAKKLGISASMVEKHMIKAIAHCRDHLDGLSG